MVDARAPSRTIEHEWMLALAGVVSVLFGLLALPQSITHPTQLYEHVIRYTDREVGGPVFRDARWPSGRWAA